MTWLVLLLVAVAIILAVLAYFLLGPDEDPTDEDDYGCYIYGNTFRDTRDDDGGAL